MSRHGRSLAPGVVLTVRTRTRRERRVEYAVKSRDIGVCSDGLLGVRLECVFDPSPEARSISISAGIIRARSPPGAANSIDGSATGIALFHPLLVDRNVTIDRGSTPVLAGRRGHR
ncbi:hypothetical protein D8S78_07520 [Natrialba swarupiae]|nr:hypothetical protein [Natrialba swarupiae]